MKVIKRSGVEEDFLAEKIINAVSAANASVENEDERLTKNQILVIEEKVENKLKNYNYSANIETIQDLVIREIMKQQAYTVAQLYTEYRFKQNLSRNSTDDSILSLTTFEGSKIKNEEIKQENSNKNPMVASTQRDYIAGETSKDISRRLLLPNDVINAHDKGIIHFHDMDYFIQRIFNCCLLNLDDMLTNGTVISETKIDRPNSFYTAANVTTQIIAQVASGQYGGQTITLSHLVPFVDISRNKLKKQVIEEGKESGIEYTEEQINNIAERRLKIEIKSGIQTLQYQILTLLTSNGQTPFISITLYLDEVNEGRERDDLALIIEEVLNQRILGVKNDKDVYITPAFPKLLYILDEDNIYEDSKYYYLTELAAKCTAKRMVPDYISAKIMKEYKNGDVYPCMGCVDGKETITYKFEGKSFVESFERMWNKFATIFQVKEQYNIEGNPNLYIDLQNVEIYDTKLQDFTPCYRVIRNVSDNWVNVNFNDGRKLLCTSDHPMEVVEIGVVQAGNLQLGDKILANDNIIEVDNVVPVYDKVDFSYDVTTESEHFEVSGIYSHNCRSFLTPDRFTDIGIKNIANATNYVEGKHRYYGRLTNVA